MKEIGSALRKERIKLAVAKLACLVIVVALMISLAFEPDQSFGYRLSSAAALVGALGIFMNLCKVKNELSEFNEPPYEIDGHGLAVLIFGLLVASVGIRFIG